MNDEEFKEYLKNKNCRGCSNRCSLTYPGCNRSKVFIEEELKKIEEKEIAKKKDQWKNISLF